MNKIQKFTISMFWTETLARQLFFSFVLWLFLTINVTYREYRVEVFLLNLNLPKLNHF